MFPVKKSSVLFGISFICIVSHISSNAMYGYPRGLMKYPPLWAHTPQALAAAKKMAEAAAAQQSNDLKKRVTRAIEIEMKGKPIKPWRKCIKAQSV